MLAFVRNMTQSLTIALAQFRPRKGDYAANLARLGRLLADADALVPRPDVVHFPETALTGYFLEGGVREVARPAAVVARDLDEQFRSAVPLSEAVGRSLDVVVGFYELWQDTLYNSAMYVTLGGTGGPVIRHVHRKVFLPTYGLFDEERFVARGDDVRAFDTAWGRAAVLVCEDAWHSLTSTIAALDGAQIISCRPRRRRAASGRETMASPVPRPSPGGTASCTTSPRNTGCTSRSPISWATRGARRSGGAPPWSGRLATSECADRCSTMP